MTANLARWAAKADEAQLEPVSKCLSKGRRCNHQSLRLFTSFQCASIAWIALLFMM